jgi:hypothetical protein
VINQVKTVSCVFLAVVLATASSLFAQDSALSDAETSQTVFRTPAPFAETAPIAQPIPVSRATRGSALPVLYTGLASLNAFDAYSTLNGVSRGAREANPLLRGAAGHPAALWTIKGATTITSIALAEREWRHHHRARAITYMVIANGAMAAVAVRNAKMLY